MLYVTPLRPFTRYTMHEYWRRASLFIALASCQDINYVVSVWIAKELEMLITKFWLIGTALQILVFVYFGWVWQIPDKYQRTRFKQPFLILARCSLSNWMYFLIIKLPKVSKAGPQSTYDLDTHDQPRGALKCTENVDSAATLQSTNSTVEIYVLIMFKLFL